MSGPGLLLGPLQAVLGCSWILCGRSGAALGSSVDGLGPLLEPLRAVMGLSWPRRAILAGDQAGKWPKPKRESDPVLAQRPRHPEEAEEAEAP